MAIGCEGKREQGQDSSTDLRNHSSKYVHVLRIFLPSTRLSSPFKTKAEGDGGHILEELRHDTQTRPKKKGSTIQFCSSTSLSFTFRNKTFSWVYINVSTSPTLTSGCLLSSLVLKVLISERDTSISQESDLHIGFTVINFSASTVAL